LRREAQLKELEAIARFDCLPQKKGGDWLDGWVGRANWLLFLAPDFPAGERLGDAEAMRERLLDWRFDRLWMANPDNT
jgi:hypothetical protein